jgi:hypothetical protein
MIQYLMEVIIIVVMARIITEMYRRVEINHPVFFILFFNLIATEISLLIDLIIMLVLSEEKISAYVVFNNYLCFQFHTVGWLVVSIQRYNQSLMTYYSLTNLLYCSIEHYKRKLVNI